MPTDCFQSPVAELSNNTGQIRKTLNIISCNNSVEYFDLDCNQMYRSTVKATLGGIQEFENGTMTALIEDCSNCTSQEGM